MTRQQWIGGAIGFLLFLGLLAVGLVWGGVAAGVGFFVFAFAGLLLAQRGSGDRFTRAEAADLIARFCDGTTEPYEWDDFTSLRYRDSVLESARGRCVTVSDRHPHPTQYCNEQGVSELRSIAAELREHAA